jgi:anti-sigma regulatory factor (Ser/Thr protein kinase)
MTGFHHSKLSIQNRIDYLPEAEAFVEKISEISGFSRHDNKQVQLALEEILTNIIKYSFLPGQKGNIDLEFIQMPAGLQIHIRVKGIPFDPALFPVYSKEELEKNYNDRGLGTFLVGQVMDELSYVNHGHEGIEVILMKHLPTRSIGQMIDAGETEAMEHGKEQAKSQTVFTTGPMQAHEAVEVSRLAYYCYGYSYPYENIYYPQKVAQLNRSGQLVSWLARTGNGEIIGHSALNMAHGNNAEIGIAFSNPLYRGMGVMNSLWEDLIGKAVNMRICGFYAMTVTTHPYSQKAAHHFGMHDCVLLVSRVPTLKFRDIREDIHPRENIMITYRYLHPPARLILHPPPRHRKMIMDIIGNTGVKAEYPVTKPELSRLERKRTRLSIHRNRDFITATIRIDHYGAHTADRVRDALKSLCIGRYETIYLYLNLNDPFTALLCPEFETLGFFFAGVFPGDENNTFLVLQYLNNQLMDYGLMKLDEGFGSVLAHYVKNCDPGQ